MVSCYGCSVQARVLLRFLVGLDRDSVFLLGCGIGGTSFTYVSRKVLSDDLAGDGVDGYGVSVSLVVSCVRMRRTQPSSVQVDIARVEKQHIYVRCHCERTSGADISCRNKWVLNITDTPLFFLLSQLVIAVILFLLAHMAGMLQLPLQLDTQVCKGLIPMVGLNVIGLRCVLPPLHTTRC